MKARTHVFPVPEKALGAFPDGGLSRKKTAGRRAFRSTQKKSVIQEKLHLVLGSQSSRPGWEQSERALRKVPLTRHNEEVLVV